MTQQAPYSAVSNQIEVQVAPAYLPNQSAPESNLFVFCYAIRIINHGNVKAKLLTRTWIIRDGHGHEQCVQGEGVVGQQPSIAPGKAYIYTSYCPLQTPTGNMRGHYRIELNDSVTIKARIPLFFLRQNDQIEEASGIYESITQP